MESHDIVKELLKRIPAKQVASELGISLSLVYKWAEAPIVGSGASNPIDRVEVLTRLCGDMAPLEWLCSRFDGAFVRRPSQSVTGEDFLYSVSKIMVELGHVLGEFTTSNGVVERVSPAKTKEIRARWERTKAMIESFILAAEQGFFTESPQRENEQSSESECPPMKITPTRYKRALGLVPQRARVPLNESRPPYS